jgi:hypothetical protein
MINRSFPKKQPRQSNNNHLKDLTCASTVVDLLVNEWL